MFIKSLKKKRCSGKKRGSIFLMLIRYYIFFTLLIILFGILSYYIAESRMRGIINEPLYQKLISNKKYLLNDEYDELPVEQLLGKGSMIQALNEKNEAIYSSKIGIAQNYYTDGELSCIPTLDDYLYAEIIHLDWQGSSKATQRLLVIHHYYQSKTVEESYLLDQDNNIINRTDKKDGRTKFSDKELGILTGDYPGTFWMQKYTYQNKEGKNRTLLLLLPNISEREYEKAWNEIYIIGVMFVLFYIGLIFLFVISMNHKFKLPLHLLNHALLNFAEGKRDGKISYRGPAEFEEICDSFNIMSKRLQESEHNNQKLQDEKTKMLADISHDLKTPVTVIQGYSKALNDGLIAQKDREQYIDIIYKKSVIVGELINKFYEYSKLEHPDFKFNLELMDICEFTREYLADKFEELSLNGYLLNVSIPEKKYYVRMDRMQIRRVFENLISNTISHTEKGTSISFLIRLEADEMMIEYEDNGGGIPDQIADIIFEPFVVEDSSRNKNQSGLGLSIVKKIIEGHYGRISLIHPIPQKGFTTYRIFLPYAEEHEN